MFGGNSWCAVLMEEILLFHIVSCYLVVWDVEDVDVLFSQGSLHQNCLMSNGSILGSGF